MRTLSRPIGMVARTLRTAAASQCVRSELQQCRHASTTPTTELVINSPMADLPLPRSISLAEFMLDDLLKHGSLPALVSRSLNQHRVSLALGRNNTKAPFTGFHSQVHR